MAYTTINFRSKKALKEAFLNGVRITVFQPSPFGERTIECGTAYLEGPHYPEPHRWYAQVEVRDGVVIKVK